MTQTNTAVQKLNEQIKAPQKPMGIEELIMQSAKQLGMALPLHMRPERLVRIALTTLKTNPKLYECNPKSFLAALFQSASLGLEPNLNGEAWIIPYNSKQGKVAQFQIGAYGWVKLFWNHQNSVSLIVESVRKNDFFEYNLGTSELKHIPPPFGKDRGEVVGYYAAATLSNGGRAIKVMSKEEALSHAKRFSKCWSKNDNSFMSGTPWREHFDAMGEVTVVKKLMKLLPKSIEIQRAFAMDESIKTEVSDDMSTVAQSVDYTEILTAEEDSEPTNGAPVILPETSQAVEVPANGNPSNDVPVLDILQSQLAELEIKGKTDDLKKWFGDNQKNFAFLLAKDRAELMKRYQTILKGKQ